jgi:hypothetical protein
MLGRLPPHEPQLNHADDKDEGGQQVADGRAVTEIQPGERRFYIRVSTEVRSGFPPAIN